MNEFKEIITNTLDQHTQAMNETISNNLNLHTTTVMETISSTLDRHTERFTELHTHINDIQDSLRDLHVNAPRP
jgi:DNA anti-recombination protein RmuC